MADENPTDPATAALEAELRKMAELADAPAPSPTASAEMSPDLAELQELLKQASLDTPTTSSSDASAEEEALADRLMAEARGSGSAAATAMPSTTAFDLPAFEKAIDAAQASSIDLLRDVDLNVKIELGRSRMLVEDVLKLVEGSVVELDKLAGDPVDVFVNDRLVARGEVLVLNDNFCVRVNEIVATIKDEA
ncbi:MAG TPA: flagellar motor switch protein FliN [Tepidisphaeraceae bacterium]